MKSVSQAYLELLRNLLASVQIYEIAKYPIKCALKALEKNHISVMIKATS